MLITPHIYGARSRYLSQTRGTAATPPPPDPPGTAGTTIDYYGSPPTQIIPSDGSNPVRSGQGVWTQVDSFYDIYYAVQNSQPNDTILIEPGNYETYGGSKYQLDTVDHRLYILHNLTIEGNGGMANFIGFADPVDTQPELGSYGSIYVQDGFVQPYNTFHDISLTCRNLGFYNYRRYLDSAHVGRGIGFHPEAGNLLCEDCVFEDCGQAVHGKKFDGFYNYYGETKESFTAGNITLNRCTFNNVGYSNNTAVVRILGMSNVILDACTLNGSADTKFFDCYGCDHLWIRNGSVLDECHVGYSSFDCRYLGALTIEDSTVIFQDRDGPSTGGRGIDLGSKQTDETEIVVVLDNNVLINDNKTNFSLMEGGAAGAGLCDITWTNNVHRSYGSATWRNLSFAATQSGNTFDSTPPANGDTFTMPSP